MTLRMIVLPLFVEVALTFVMLFGMGVVRGRAISRGDVRYEQIALREPNWPRYTLPFANSYQNQLELPILFYVLTILSYVTHHAGLAFVLLAWVFVVLRLMQAGVHVTNNKVPLRGAFFGASALVLAIMWLIYMVEIILGT